MREYNIVIHILFMDFKKAYYCIKREFLVCILKPFGLPLKIVNLIKANIVFINKEEAARLGLWYMAKILFIYVVGTIWQFNRKKTNKTTKAKMGSSGDENCKADCTRRRVTSFNNR